MTTITFYKTDGYFYGFEEQGHTGYGESGDDILCAALSVFAIATQKLKGTEKISD